MNPIDLGSVNWSAIPLDSVERIEILRGAGSVQYGDKATGGVVNIITDKSGRPRFGATLGVGTRGTQTGDLNAAAGTGELRFPLMPNRRRAILILLLLVLLSLASLWTALTTGSIRFGTAEVLAALVGNEPPGADVILQLRLPRGRRRQGSA
ncbi:TonB-dependent receptor plug domain-containing protein [Accumulibacter sp.]|uniref:TonB-dependent receptor n=1 Tax=Accumulibacter sp. TaxID=2053492 RepID=UPI0025ED3127|nr:TonB-dependent receptor plug domain-containing protein [Accumulibacter sp.]